VFIIAALGCYARHKNLLDADTARTMSRLNGAVFLPCLLFTVLGKAVKAEQLQNVWLLPIAAAVHIGLGWTLGKSVCAVFNVPREFRGPAVAAASFGNTFALPVVLLDAIIGSGNKVGHVQFTEDDNAAMVLYLSAYMTVLTTLMWTLGPVWMKAEELEADDDDDEEALGDGGSSSRRAARWRKSPNAGMTGTKRRVAKARGEGAESQKSQNRGGAGAQSRWPPRRTLISSRR
jgi:auxin efflux carrier family protein